MKTKEVTLGSLNVGDVFIFGGVKFTVNDNIPSRRKPNDDYLMNVRIGESKKGCYMSNCVLVEVSE